MNKSEQKLWQKIKLCMGNTWDYQRHEDRYSVGIPDVSFAMGGINGWIELKYIKNWPKSGPVLISHFTPQQKNWLYKRDMHGGGCFLLLQVGDEYIMIMGYEVLNVGYIRETELLRMAVMHLHNPSNDELRLALHRCIINLSCVP